MGYIPLYTHYIPIGITIGIWTHINNPFLSIEPMVQRFNPLVFNLLLYLVNCTRGSSSEVSRDIWIIVIGKHMGMDQYLLIPFLVGWTSIYQLFWGSLGTRVLTHPHISTSGTGGLKKNRIVTPQLIHSYPILVGGLEHGFYLSIYWECHNPNWRTHMFQRGRLHHQPDIYIYVYIYT